MSKSGTKGLGPSPGYIDAAADFGVCIRLNFLFRDST